MSTVTPSGFIRARDRDSWLEERRSCIGASDSASVLGANPYKSAFALWAEKTGNAEPEDLSENLAVQVGIELESLVARHYAKQSGRTVKMWPQFQIARHADYPWMSCTPDATQVDDVRGDGLCQIKTTSDRSSQDWDEEPPLHYQIQCQHEMAVMNASWCSLVVLIGNRKLKWFDLNRNDKFIAALIPKLADFWAAVQSGEPVAVDGSEATKNVLKRIYATDDGSVIALPPDAMEWTRQIEEAKAAIKAAEEVQTECENKIKSHLGSATIGLLADGSRWSWKSSPRKGYVVEPTTVRTLRKLK